MPYARDNYSKLAAAAAQDIAGALPGSDPLLRFSNLGILGKILARFANLHYGYLDWISRMAVPFTAVGEYLLGWGSLKNVQLKQATYAGIASGTVKFSNSTIGVLIPSGSLVQRGDGFLFNTLADGTVGIDGTVTIRVKAAQTGDAGNTPPGSILTLGVTIPGIQTNGVVFDGIVGGADTETMDEYRSRVLQVYQAVPQGGAVADYIKWALEVPGVTRAWCQPLGMGPGTVIVRFMMDVAQAVHQGFPQGTDGVATAETRAVAATGDQLTVANYIYGDNTTGRQPVGALVYSVAPIALLVNFTISHIAGVSAAIKTQINQAIDGVFLEFGVPGGVVDLSDIEAAIAAIPGTEGFVITIPADNISLPAGNLPQRGVVTYI